jgi:transcriptional regulator with XRE-family HTH domain
VDAESTTYPVERVNAIFGVLAWTASQRPDKPVSSAKRHDAFVISKTAIARETDRRMRHVLIRIGDDIRQLRLDAGVSLRQLAEATGIDASHLARIEKGTAHASVETLTAVAIALGGNLSLRFYADAGPRIHDRFQAPMIEGLLRSVHLDWSPGLEVVVPGKLRGVADIVLTHRIQPVLVVGEVQSQFRRIEQQLRWMAEKTAAFEASRPDGVSVSRLLVLRSTTTTREIARRYEALLRVAYPARAAELFRALTTADVPWPGSGIVWMRLENGSAELLDGPPRGVRLGR